MSISNLIPGVPQLKMIGIGMIVAGLLGLFIWTGYLHNRVKELKQDNIVLVQNNKVLQDNNDTLKKNLETAKETNTTNTETIERLKKERSDAVKAVEDLSKKQQSNVKTIGELQTKIDDMKQNPANNGTLSPVLREAIRGIQSSGVTP